MSTLFADLKAALEQITVANGYSQTLAAVHIAPVPAPDKQPLPYALLRPVARQPNGEADRQSLQVLTLEVDLVMPRATTADQLLDAERDVLRAVGYCQTDDDLAHLLDAELINTVFTMPTGGVTTSGLTLTLGIVSPVTY